MVFKNVECAIKFYVAMKNSEGNLTSIKPSVRRLIIDYDYTYDEGIKKSVIVGNGNCELIEVDFFDSLDSQDLMIAFCDISKPLEYLKIYEIKMLFNYACDGKKGAFRNIKNASFNKKPLTKKLKLLKKRLRGLESYLIKVGYISYKKAA